MQDRESWRLQREEMDARRDALRLLCGSPGQFLHLPKRGLILEVNGIKYRIVCNYLSGGIEVYFLDIHMHLDWDAKKERWVLGSST